MIDDEDDDDIALDWSAALEAARAGQLARGDRPDLPQRGREAPREGRRSPRGPKRVPKPGKRLVEQLAFDFSETVVCQLRLPRAAEAVAPRTSPKPRASFIPFPLGRRRKLVNLLAGQMATASTGEAAERLFQGRAAKLARGLRRKRVPEHLIEREMCALEAAVGAALRRIVLDPAQAGKKSDGR